MTAALNLAVQARDIDGIQSALSAADELSLDTKETRDAEKLLHLLEEQITVRHELESALAEKSIKMVSAMMKKAEAVEIPATEPLMVEAAAFCESRKKQLDALTSLQVPRLAVCTMVGRVQFGWPCAPWLAVCTVVGRVCCGWSVVVVVASRSSW